MHATAAQLNQCVSCFISRSWSCQLAGGIASDWHRIPLQGAECLLPVLLGNRAQTESTALSRAANRLGLSQGLCREGLCQGCSTH